MERCVGVMGEFEIELDGVERESVGPFGPDEFKVSFRVTRDGNAFEVAVWIDVGETTTSDLLRLAMHNLHLDLVQLAEQTKAWSRMAPE